MKAINTHIDNVDVCENGCDSLWNMTANNGNYSDKVCQKQIKWTAENKEAAGEAGAIEAVVKAINTHIDNADVCENGCGALKNMTVNGKRWQWQQQHRKQCEN